MQRSEKLRLAAIVLAGAIPVLIGLRWALPGPYHLNTYNCDENTPMAHLQAMDPARLDFSPVGERTPNALGEGTFHLYTFAVSLKALALAKALTLVPDKEFYYANPAEWARFYLAGRGLSALYGALSVVVLYFLGRAMFGPAAAALAALFLALAPAHTAFSRYLLMNGPGLFWIILAIFLFKRLMDTGESRFYWLGGIAAGLAVSTRYSAAPLVLPLLAAHLLGPRRALDLRQPLLGLLAMAAAFLIGTPYSVLDFAAFQRGTGAIAGVVTQGTGGLRTLAAAFCDGTGGLLAAAGLGGLVFSLWRRTKDDLLLAAWTLPLLAIFVKAAAAASAGRMLPLFPFLALYAARALAAAGEKFPSVRRAGAALILAELLLFQAATARLLLAEDLRDAASRWLAENARPGAVIGLLREPSWFGPGVVELKYRHPLSPVLPGASFARLTSGEWASSPGYDRLAAQKPGLVIVSSTEAGYLDEAALEAALAGAGYSPAARFRADFSLFGFKLRARVPKMFFIPDWLRIYARPAKG
ncbi:MAG: glycosyltransferase family 39 protein [Elusimicrobiales bacterium]|nr:glycosyltransferase family 39 protein [Elusimicrobiales bacterium]